MALPLFYNTRVTENTQLLDLVYGILYNKKVCMANVQIKTKYSNYKSKISQNMNMIITQHFQKKINAGCISKTKDV
jgi:hypothetical protein